MRIKIKKIFSATIALLFIFSFSAPSALADFSYPQPSQAANQAFTGIEQRLGIDESEVKANMAMINSARYKKQSPEVTLNFTPLNPVLGEKVTVVATPSYFLNNEKDLYFTWMLRPAGCPDREDTSPSQDKKDKCDENGDGKINIEDYKVKAMRLLASNDFDYKKADYSDDGASDGDGYDAILGGNDQGGKKVHCYVRNVTSGLDYELGNGGGGSGSGCEHLFPHAPGEKTGDGSFGRDEEKFWHTDPRNPDTAGSGNGDEANVAGLGEDTFSWNYNSGDKVGVVVEGVSVDPTTYKDSSFKMMWATPKPLLSNPTGLEEGTVTSYDPTVTTNNVNLLGGTAPGHSVNTDVTTVVVTKFNKARTEATITTTKTTTATEYDQNGQLVSKTAPDTNPVIVVGTPTVETQDISSKLGVTNGTGDLNDLLYDTLIDPQEGGSAVGAKLDASLSYTPDSPMNDSSKSGQDGDQVVVTSAITNADNPDYLDYSWQVYSGNEPNPSDWGDPLPISQLSSPSETSGVGLINFHFNLNFPNPKKYLRVLLTVRENSSGAGREGRTDVVIPISSSSDKIKVFNTSVSDNLQFSMGGAELCKDGLDATLCPVTKDQLVGMQVPDNFSDYSWTLDGDQITYPKCFFSGCNLQKQTNVAYFPVLEDPGYQYTVNLTATDVKGQNISLTKTFQVSEPDVSISSDDTKVCAPVLLGNYIDIDGKTWPDYSDENFQALSYSPLKLKADYVGGAPTDDNSAWFVDGLLVTKDNAADYGYDFDSNNDLILPGKPTDENYDIAIEALYAPDNLTKKALNTYWNVSYEDFYEQTASKGINIDLVNNLNGTTNDNIIGAEGGSKKFLASVISSVPTYFAFLFRMVLTAFVLLMASRFILSFFPNMGRREE